MRTARTAEDRSPSKRVHSGRSYAFGLLLAVPLVSLVAYLLLHQPGPHTRPLIYVTLLLMMLAIAWSAGSAFARRRERVPLSLLTRLLRGGPSASAEISRLRGDVGDLARTFDQMARTIESYDRDSAARNLKADRVSRAYGIMSGINSVIRRTRDRDALCTEICRLAVERGGFRFAWIGLYEAATFTIDLRWYAGNTDGFLAPLHAALNEGRYFPAKAVVSGEVYINNDLATDTESMAVNQPALDLGLRSCALLPLLVDGDVTAVIGLYAVEPGHFDTEETAILREIAADTALCLDYIEKEESLHQLSYYDNLTALPNRVLFTDRLDQSLARESYTARHVALVMGHIDRFKEINSAYGRHAGDAVLQEVARRLVQTVRPGDTVARTGDAAFGIILTDVAQPGDAALVARKIGQAVNTPVIVGEREIFVTLGLGIAVSPEDGLDTETLIANATTAEHMIDREPGTRYRFYTPEIDARARERFSIERELRRALERGEFELHYQPIVDLKSLRISGSEALLRWYNPRLGPISPAVFIPVAERSGLIVAIGEWVLETASVQASRWQALGLPSRIAVNASAIQLKEEDFEDRAHAILAKTRHDPSGAGLTLEITETNLMENPERAATQLHRLRDKGLSVSIDDFGTGYSSLSYLKRLPVDSLKIDISFVHDLTNEPGDMAIVRAIAALAHSLGLKVIAEGVETPEQLKILRDVGCDAAQGFLFSPAVAPANFEALCRSDFKLKRTQ